MSLVSVGAQNLYITANPQVTFFKTVYRRHTNFAQESIEVTFQGETSFGKQLDAVLQRSGDLAKEIYFVFDLPAIINPNEDCDCDAWVHWTNAIGHAIIERVQVLIGGQCIDEQFGEFLEIWEELTADSARRLEEMIGKRFSRAQLIEDAKLPRRYYTPLQFWFNRNAGLALPLIALQYHEVRLQFHLRRMEDLFVTGSGNNVDDNCGCLVIPLKTQAGCSGFAPLSPNDLNAFLYVNYVFLDTDERRRFAQLSHEYLITQVQQQFSVNLQGGLSLTAGDRLQLNLNHPIKALFWVVQRNCHVARKDWFNYAGLNGEDPIALVKLTLNNHDRFSVREARYFRLVVPWEAWPAIPRRFIYTYSFALYPAEQQPSGVTNFSRIDNAYIFVHLQPGLTDAVFRVYGLGYNVLRIMSGMGGLAYSN
jgi:hypothetical protein